MVNAASQRRAWIGSGYAERRILILGESNWGIDLDDAAYVEHWLEHPAFLTQPECPTCAACGPARHGREKDYKRDALFDALTRMMLNYESATTDKNRREAWSRIAFANFILHPPRDLSDGERPNAKDYLDAKAAFPVRLAVIAPRVAVALVLDNPLHDLKDAATPLLEGAGVRVVVLAHLTIIQPGGGTVLTPERAAAWADVCGRGVRSA